MRFLSVIRLEGLNQFAAAVNGVLLWNAFGGVLGWRAVDKKLIKWGGSTGL